MNAAPEPGLGPMAEANEAAKDGHGHQGDDQHHQGHHPCRPAIWVVVRHLHLGDLILLQEYFCKQSTPHSNLKTAAIVVEGVALGEDQDGEGVIPSLLVRPPASQTHEHCLAMRHNITCRPGWLFCASSAQSLHRAHVC